MIPDTQLEEDQRRRLDQQVGSASDAEMAQMGGAPQSEWSPDWRNGVPDEPPAPVEAASDAETAQPPGPVPESAPQSKPATAVELLAQVKAGQLSRPAIDAAFGPPPTPQNEPGAQTFAPKLGDSAGIDWKGLSDRLKAAHGEAGRKRGESNFFANVGNTGKYVTDERLGSDDVAGAEDELKLQQAKQADAEKQRAALASGDELKRRAEADQWRRFDAGLKGVTAAQLAADKLKAEGEKDKLAAEGRAMTGDREDQKMLETQRQHDLEHEDRQAGIRARHAGGLGPKAKAAADKAAKTETNVQTMVDNIYNGESDPAELGSRSSEFKQDFETKMAEQHPHFSLAKAAQMYKGLNEYADPKPGTAGDQVQAAKVAAQHLDLMEEQFKKLGNSNSRGANELRNAFARQFGYGSAADALGSMKAGNVTTGSELAKTYNDLSQHGHESFEAILDPATPPEVAAAQFAIIREQMAVRMKQREDALRRYAQSPGHHKLIDELGLSQKAGAESTKAGPKEGDEKTTSNGKAWVFRNGEWAKK